VHGQGGGFGSDVSLLCLDGDAALGVAAPTELGGTVYVMPAEQIGAGDQPLPGNAFSLRDGAGASALGTAVGRRGDGRSDVLFASAPGAAGGALLALRLATFSVLPRVTLDDAARPAGLVVRGLGDLAAHGFATALADLDRDGTTDLAVAGADGVYLFRGPL
jgi:hypothetical protein